MSKRPKAQEKRPIQAVLVPGFNGRATQPMLVRLAGLLRERGIAPTIVELPKGRPSPHLAAEVDALERACPDGPLMLVGRSFGGRVCARLAAKREVLKVALLGYPIHPPGRHRPEDEVALANLAVPTLIVQGDQDELGPMKVLKPIVEANRDLSLHVLRSTGHAFGGRELAALTATADWLAGPSTAPRRVVKQRA